MMTEPKHPFQPVVWAEDNVIRFKKNRIVDKLLDMATMGATYSYNNIALDYQSGLYTREEMVQFAQLVGYSVSGWGSLKEVSDEDYDIVDAEVKKLLAEKESK